MPSQRPRSADPTSGTGTIASSAIGSGAASSFTTGCADNARPKGGQSREAACPPSNASRIGRWWARRLRRLSPPYKLLCLAEHALEDRVDVLEVIAEVEVLLDLGGLQLGADGWIALQEREEIALALPDLHGVRLHRFVGVLARHAGLGQRDQHPLRMHQPAEPVEVLLHVAGIDHELVDQAGQAIER